MYKILTLKLSLSWNKSDPITLRHLLDLDIPHLDIQVDLKPPGTSIPKRTMSFLKYLNALLVSVLLPEATGFALSPQHFGLASRTSHPPLSATPSPDEPQPIDVDSDERLYRVSLSRATGIEWGTDLSFSFVNVREMDPSGAASMSGRINVGDQLCELKAVQEDAVPINLVGAPFDFVMEAFGDLDRSVTDLELVFFRGTKDELKAAAKGEKPSNEPEKITVTVIENNGSDDETVHKFTAAAGVNVRELCVDNGINVYQSITRWTNCKGKQLCGTCIVNVPEGGPNTNRKSMDEASTLRENPETYRLSCVTFAYGDVTIETFPPIEASQWTR